MRVALFMTTCLLVKALSTQGLAGTITVGPSGQADHASIQDAVDQAQSGDEIVVYPGTYTVDDSSQTQVVDLLGKSITLRSCDGPEATLIDGQGVARGIVCAGQSEGQAVIEGFTVINGIGVQCDMDGDGDCSPWETNGGGLHVFNATPVIRNCWFIDNTAVIFGGAAYCRQSGALFQECRFEGNTSDYKGGALFNFGSKISVESCRFLDNSAAYTGGGIHNRQSELSVSDCIFQSNLANVAGAAVYSQWNSSAVVSGSIFCENINSDGELDQVSGSWVDQGDNCFAESCEDADGNGYPDDCDPCAADSTDSDGDGLCDAIDPCPEYPGACSSQLGGGNIIEVAVGESIQEAIELAQDGDTVQLAPGTYYEAINLLGKAITVRSGDGCVSGERATIDATGLLSPVVTCNQDEGRETRLIGLTLTGGSALNGGGIYCWFSSPTIEDCHVIGNLAFDDGGGIMIGSGHAAVRRCIIQDNMSLEEGGGVFVEYSDAFIEDCHIEGNVAKVHGGGICTAHDGSVTITGCTFQDNTADSSGGGLATIDCVTTLTACDFQNNQAYYYGGGYYNNRGSSIVSSCRFESNESIEGAGLGSENGPSDVSGSVFCDNRDPDGDLRNIHGDWNDLGANQFSETCSDPGCPSDINNDGVTNVEDLLLLIDVYGPCPEPDGCKADIDGNGAVDCPDVLLLIDGWGPCNA